MLVVFLTNQKDYELRGVVSIVSQVGWSGFHRKASCGLSILFESRYINSIPSGTPSGGGKQVPLGQVAHRRFYFPRRHAHIG